MSRRARPCPCGGGAYDACCGPVHRREREPATPEGLVRSRYSAFARGDTGWLLASWHSSTRPPVLELDRSLHWTGLEVVQAFQDVVAFRASYRHRGVDGVLAERSRFRREGDAWRYLDGTPL